MIPQDKTLYVELAKLNKGNRHMVMMYLKNRQRLLQQEMAAAATATKQDT